MRRLVEEEPVGFVGAVRVTLYALLGAVGWIAGIEADLALTVGAPTVAVVEAWTLLLARRRTTPEAVVVERVETAVAVERDSITRFLHGEAERAAVAAPGGRRRPRPGPG